MIKRVELLFVLCQTEPFLVRILTDQTKSITLDNHTHKTV